MNITTSRTLLEKVKENNNNVAWSRFYDLYSPLIFGFALQRGCDHATAEDVLQETMCQLVRYLPNFEYLSSRGQFSTYLCKIVLSVISKRFLRSLPTQPLPLSSDESQIDIPEADSVPFWNEFEQKRKETLMKHALMKIKERIDPLTWKSFEAYVINGGKSADEVAANLGFNDRNIVYQHKNRVIRLLQEEVAKFEREIGDTVTPDEIEEEDYAEVEFATLLYASEMPSTDIAKRFKLIRKSFSNHPPSFSETPQFLVLTAGNSRWVALKDNFSIGSDKDNSLQIKSGYLSQHHCLVTNTDRGWIINDLQSKNGVMINHKCITKKKIINNGDIVQLGNIILIFSADKSKAEAV